MIAIIVLETIAANLGSMLTPVGNPQNLYLYSLSGMGVGEFILIMTPLTVLSLVLIVAACLLQRNEVLDKETLQQMDLPSGGSEGMKSHCKQENIVLAILFVLSLLSVARILPWQALLIITIVVCLAMWLVWKDGLLLIKVDYNLLLTFVAFFVFIGNMERIEVVGRFISGILSGHELIIAFGCSQIISNVPAAILLSGFTNAYEDLLLGVNIGGLGTLIASLASLISYKMYAVECSVNDTYNSKGRYMVYFTLENVLFAAILLGVVFIMK